MKYLKYFLEFFFSIIAFTIFKILGPSISSNIGGIIFEKIGPLFRSKKIIHSNIKKAIPDINNKKLKLITKMMWNNYGRIFAEYIYLKEFRKGKLETKIEIDGYEILKKIKEQNKQVVFISGHLSNFELMAMYLEKNGIKLSSIYRPLNNIFLNTIMERIRIKYICKYQIKKGIGGIKKLIKLHKENFSTALMIDQRVSEGILSNFFKKPALTTTIPAQLVKKFNTPIVPVYIERIGGIKFKITIHEPITFDQNTTVQKITDDLNSLLEEMILRKPEQWIWTHNRWK
tara:strand:+ start:1515 stop:2375 length:861 start_codon:yes stop_codon:yes gene_type:complete